LYPNATNVENLVMYTPIASMKVVICCLFNVRNAQAMQGCCSQDCVDVIHLPEEEQKKRSVVGENGNKIFKKENQMLTLRIEANLDPLAAPESC
jgi:hypothetical protein